MFKSSSTVKNQLQDYKMKNGLYKRVPVSSKERDEIEQLLATGHTLPDGVFNREPENEKDVDLYYRIEETDLKDSEIIEFMLLSQNRTLQSIKIRVNYLLALVVIALAFLYLLAR